MIEIMDDGVGMSSTVEQINEKKKHHLSGIGVNNVHARIQLLFGADYGVQIESEAGYGTAIKITLPVTQSVERMNN
ncbi:Histidine kinase-, DNA gyrase B-, and HSP90-like ATPase [compost metagenome]